MMMTNYTEYIWAGDPLTPPALFEHLAHFANECVRRRAAETNRCSRKLLAELAQDPSPEVRIAVCHNEMTPLAVLEGLVSDANPTVRYSLATNPRLPKHLLERLKIDENPYVACRAVKTASRMIGS